MTTLKDIKYDSKEQKKLCKDFLRKYKHKKSVSKGYLTPKAYIKKCLPEVARLCGEDAKLTMEFMRDPE